MKLHYHRFKQYHDITFDDDTMIMYSCEMLELNLIYEI